MSVASAQGQPAAPGWFGALTRKEKHTFWGAFGGFGIDALDIQLYSFVMPTLIGLWGLSRTEAGMVATVALLISAVGGWIGGMLADRYGRVLTLQITIAWFTFFTALSGLTNSYEQLLVVRALQGFGFGAEWAIGAALMSEIVQPRHRGKALGFVQSSWAIGWGVAALIYALAFYLLPETIAWRALFFAAILPSLFILYIRKNIEEPEIFVRGTANEGKARLFDIFSGRVLYMTIFTSLLATGVQGGFYAIATWLPTYLKTVRNLSVLNTSGYLAVIITAAFCGYIVGAYLTDAIGRRLNFGLFAVGAILTVVLYTFVTISDGWMLVLGFPIGFCYAGTFSGLGSYFAELFPTRVRGTGMGFAYNFGRAVGALFPTLVGYLSQHIALETAIGIFTTGSYALVLVAVLALPETNGRELPVD
jgi:MFS family permease